jgi:hypothetical protein
LTAADENNAASGLAVAHPKSERRLAGVRDDFRNWVGLGLEAREEK